MNKLNGLIRTQWKKHEILRVFTAVFSVDALVKGGSLLLLPVYLIFMTEAEYGLFNYFLTIIGIYAATLSFGLNIAQNKLYFESDDPVERGKVLFSTNFILAMMLSAAIILLYFSKLDYQIIALLIKNPVDYDAYRNAVFLSIFVAVYMPMLLSFLLLEKKIKMLQVYNLIRLILINGCIISLFIFMKGDKILIRILYTALTELIVLAFFYIFYVQKMVFSMNLAIVKKALFIGIPFTLAAIPALAIVFVDKFFIEKYTSVLDLSIYYLAFTISGIIPAVFISIQNVWQPYFYNEKNFSENRRKTKKLILNILALFIGLSVLIFMGTKLALLFKLFDEKYAGILKILPFMLLTQIIVSVCTLLGNYMIYFNKTYLYLIINLILFPLVFYFTKFMTENYKLNGAILATLIYSGVFLIVYFFVVRYLFSSVRKKDRTEISSNPSESTNP